MKVTSVQFFIPNFNLSSCKLDNLKCYIESLYIDTKFKENKITILSQLLVKNLKCFLSFLQ